ncbi:probable cytochrome P450 28d1 isoform X2 [Lucilia sericata]|uniref:probable cytochrome P450 28d1 isoform X2 n=1 Tax=Lucilia sericata TaxID=13632 RepID=UPI0018A81F89|nr:probable cytochrome P450 28d1 isoform X2 [Lucilia sericata]
MYQLLLYILILFVSVILSLYVYLTWHFDHWIKRKIPGPKPLPLFGTFPGMVNAKRNFIYDLDEVYRQFKNKAKFVGVFVTRNPQIMILDPEICKDILITNFKSFQDNESSQWMNRKKEPISGSNPFALPAADWKIKRAEIVPAMTMSRVKGMFSIVEAICKKMNRYLKHIVETGQTTIDAKDIALHFTGEVVADVGWGIEAGNFVIDNANLAKEDTPFLSMSKQLIAQTFNAFKYFFIAGIFPIVRYLVYVRFFPEITDRFFLQLTKSALQIRKSNANNNRQDFLQHMMELQQKKGISETEIVAHQLTLLFDGFETSATLISHCLLLLARYPEKQEKLRLEIQQHFEAHANTFDFDELVKLPYLEQCLAETLRIFTPLPYMAKVCTQPCELLNNDGVSLQLQPGDVCLIPLHSLHHDEEYYPQPEVFVPERFDEENGGTKKYKDMGVYLPFGDGPRICIGMKFGLSQAKAAVAQVIKHFELTVNERTRKDNYQAADGFIIGLDGGIFLDIKAL